MTLNDKRLHEHVNFSSPPASVCLYMCVLSSCKPSASTRTVHFMLISSDTQTHSKSVLNYKLLYYLQTQLKC